ncbi:MAG: response regulator [Lachnospiraceae bacterium]|nr:response regulator [Lachnospiraceae bacterium]
MLRENRILLLRKEETFLVDAIRSNLINNDYQVDVIGITVRELSKHKDESAVMILYADQSILEAEEFLVYLKDLCGEENKILIVVGDREEFEFIDQHIPSEDIVAKILRPLDMHVLMSKVEEVTDEEYEEERKKCVLIVDDDVTYLQMMRQWLKDKFRVGMAASAPQAITFLTANRADLILMDYEIPVTKGPQIVEMLRSEASFSSIPVMFLTGKSDRESILSVVDLKPVGYLLKSMDRSDLVEKIEEFFGTQRYIK